MSLNEIEKSEAQEKFDACLDHLERLTDWEQHFIEQNSELFEKFGVLSPRQLEILEEIYNKVK